MDKMKDDGRDPEQNSLKEEETKDIGASTSILSNRQRHVLVGLIGLCIVCLMTYLLFLLLNILK